MTPPPARRDPFPVSWPDDHLVTRRQFARSLSLVSCASFVASAGLALRSAPARPAGPPTKVAEPDELPLSGAKVFAYPEGGEPCLLIRRGPEEYVAFVQRCPHLGCPVYYRAEGDRLHCPCHEGHFDASSGAVLSGPPPRPLARVRIELREDGVFAVGVEA